MPYIVVDTCVFIRLPSDYKRTLDCILTTNDEIAVTKTILNEYAGRAYASNLILQAFLEYLRSEGKLKHFQSSFVAAARRRHRRAHRINYPPHEKDKKWIDVALATSARYIVSTNRHMLELQPNRCNEDPIETIDPQQYNKVRCPNENN